MTKFRPNCLFDSADNTARRYLAKLVPDPHQSYRLKQSCNADQLSTIVKYSVAELSASEYLDPPSLSTTDSYQASRTTAIQRY